jgi:hypothetical protein
MKGVASSLLLALLLVAPGQAADSIAVAKTGTATNAALGLTVVGTEVDLPVGRWEIGGVTPANVLHQIFLVAETAPADGARARRVHEMEIQRRTAAGQWQLQSLFVPCREYATAHGGKGPRSFSDLDPEKYGGLVRSLASSPWPEDAGKAITDPFYFLVPGVPIQGTANQSTPGTPLVLELRPYVDDGKHWVLFSDGHAERRAIDAALLATYHVRLTFVERKRAVEPATVSGRVPHTIVALLRNPNATAATITLAERGTGARTELRWNLGAGQPDPSLIGRWADARAREWQPYLAWGDAAILGVWATRTKELYGGHGELVGADPRTPREIRSTDAFNVLGGRAAVAETLQTQVLRARTAATQETATIPLSTVKGVDVKSHPFVEMLGGKAGGRLPLADHVPADHFFIYFAKPSAFFPFLEHGADFLFHAGALFTRSSVDDDLKGRYLRRLGLGEKHGRTLLESGEVIELGLVTPDLFFLDGTDVTVLMRVKRPDRLAAAMKDLAIVDIKAEGVTAKPLDSGRSAWWARQRDLFLVSTSRAEIDAVLALGPRPEAGSLGRTPELRYMLSQLPMTKDTRAFVYLSDPFIRRMVSPGVKIAQLRRMRARAEMQTITAGALLFLLDGKGRKPELDTLVRLGYVPRSGAGAGYRLRDDLSVVSTVWGTAADMSALGVAPIDAVTPSEAEAYRGYVDEYRQYWRQYFDPVAMRLDDAPGGALELSTFILPLLDSQVYNQLRGVLSVQEKGPALRVPVVAPDPALFLSMNLTDDAWTKISGGFSEMFSQYTGISPSIFDQLGSGLHIAIQDADPVIVLGNADLLGSFGGAAVTAEPMSHGLPLLFALLTRPTKILVELRDERATLDILRRATSGASNASRGVRVEFRQITGRDAWIYSLNMAGIVKIRLGIEVRNGYLVLSNIPWSQPLTVKAIAQRPLNGAELQIAPGAVRLGLPGLFATDSEQSQMASLKGMASLLPLLLTVSPTPDAAAARHATLFGWKPVHPGPGTWVWKDGTLQSTSYGTATVWQEPLYRPEMGDFGLFEGVQRLSVNMQIESGGLRAVARWLWKRR